MKKINVLMLPEWRSENPYQNLLATNLEKLGAVVSFSDYPRTLFPISTSLKRNSAINVVHLHWIAPYIHRALWSTKPHIQLLKLILFKIDLFLVKLNGTKIVWTIHNLYSHESANKYFEGRIRKLISKSSDIIIFHSKRNLIEFEKIISKVDEGKVRIIPHGNYINQYPTQKSSSHPKDTSTPSKINILFLGQIRKYKGLDSLVSALNKNSKININLIIAGKVIDNDLSDRLIKITQIDTRFTYKPGFVKDDDLADYFHWADAVIIPFEKTLTSGSAILGLSMGKVLILPASAEVIGLPPESKIIYYAEDKLSTCLEELPRKEDLRKDGDANLEVAKKLDWKIIGELTAQAYQ